MSTPYIKAQVDELMALARIRSHPPRWWQGSTRLDRIGHLLSELGESGERPALMGLLCGLVHAEPGVVRAASIAAQRFLDFWPFPEWPSLESWPRRIWRLDPAFGSWRGADGAEIVARLPADGPPRVAGLGLLSWHPNGFVRQRVVRALAREGAGPEVLAALLLRLDDWVDEVREKAQKVFADRVQEAEPKDLVAVLPIVQRLAGHQRFATDQVRGRLGERLDSDSGRRALLQGLADPSRSVARGCLALIPSMDPAPGGWVQVGLGSPETLIRLSAARAWSATVESAVGAGTSADKRFEENLAALGKDGLVAIRHLALDVAEASGQEHFEPLVRRLLFDRSAAVRRRCQEALTMDLDVDPAPLYLELIESFAGSSDPRTLSSVRWASCLLGLAETGGLEHRAVFEAHIKALHPRARAAAVFGLGRLADRGDADTFLGCLSDPSPRVARAAERVLSKMPWPIVDLVQVLGSTTQIHGCLALVRLGFRLSKWDQILFLADACDHPDRTVASAASVQLGDALFNARGWSFGPPTEAQRRRLEPGAEARRVLGPKLEAQLDFILRLTSRG